MKKQMAEMMKMMTTLVTKNNQDSASSVSDDDKKPFEFDPQHLINNIFTKLYPKSGDSMLIIELLKMVYAVKPEIFVAQGGIHSNPDGSRTYQSLKVHINPSFSVPIHIYGTYRWNKFRMTTMEVFYKRDTYNYDYSGL